MSAMTHPLIGDNTFLNNGFEVSRIRHDFPILQQRLHGNPLVYLDNAATSQKPLAVIEAISRYYLKDNSNVHRGVHALSQQATDAFENARSSVRRFLNAGEDREIIFTRGATEAINLVASSFGKTALSPGDEILISAMEHHSNIVPWQLLCQDKGAHLRVIPMTDEGELLIEEYEKLLNSRTRLVSVTHLSNALGTINPVQTITRMAHAKGVPVLLDGAQAISHLPVDVQALDCDFYVFSAHKVYGPTGVGVLYGKAERLEAMPPYQGGGDMIRSVSFTETTFNSIPYKFEAGTPDISGVIGLAAALDYVTLIGLDKIGRYEHDLLTYATQAVSSLPNLKVIGRAKEKASVLSFVLEGVHPHDIGTILDQQGIAIRAGHHCAQPVMDRLGIPATARASFALYNTREEVDALVNGLKKINEIFG
jgi:cysteine desulfurase / selenocysteine lyase